MSHVLRPVPLTEAAFAPFGSVVALPAPGVNAAIGPAQNLRPSAPVSLRWVQPRARVLPLAITTMERHRFSSQSFVPAAPAQWLVLVAPHAGNVGPDMAAAIAFLADATQAITYRPDTWHHPLTALSDGAVFSVLTFLDGSGGDEEFVPVAEGIMVAT